MKYFLALMFCSSLAFAQEAAVASDAVEQPAVVVPAIPDTGSADYVISSVRLITDAFKSKKYGPAFSLLIMLLLASANFIMLRLDKSIQKEWFPTLAIISGVLMAIAMNLAGVAAGASLRDWLVTIISGAAQGAAAVGLWELLGKKILNRFLKPKDVVA